MGGEPAEVSGSVPTRARPAGGPREDDVVDDLASRRERRAQAHEYWNARPQAVREHERDSAPETPYTGIRPIVDPVTPPAGQTAAGLPRRAVPAHAPSAATEASRPAVAAPPAPPTSAPAVPAPPTSAALARPAAAIEPPEDVEESLAMLVALAPNLDCLATDPHADSRVTYADCQALLARLGRSVTDRRVWRSLLTLSESDPDADVRTAAATALDELERHGTLPRD